MRSSSPTSAGRPVTDAVRDLRAAHDWPVELLVFEDEGHGIAKLENRIEAYTRVVAFLDEHV
jgi:dipeptidyl aminopeptidase/acylaminoacyl peptidase